MVRLSYGAAVMAEQFSKRAVLDSVEAQRTSEARKAMEQRGFKRGLEAAAAFLRRFRHEDLANEVLRIEDHG
jgi:hypothetical protein